MKVSDLQQVNEIDSLIQNLLGQLSELCNTRVRLTDLTQASTKNKTTSKNSTGRLEDIDFSSIDLTLTN